MKSLVPPQKQRDLNRASQRYESLQADAAGGGIVGDRESLSTASLNRTIASTLHRSVIPAGSRKQKKHKSLALELGTEMIEAII
jgi:hypothetical protein